MARMDVPGLEFVGCRRCGPNLCIAVRIVDMPALVEWAITQLPWRQRWRVRLLLAWGRRRTLRRGPKLAGKGRREKGNRSVDDQLEEEV